MENLDLSKLAGAEIGKLQEAEPFPVMMPPLVAFLVISQLQLAFRHPENNGLSREIVESFAKQLQRRVAAPGSGLDTILNMGWDAAFDVEIERKTP